MTACLFKTWFFVAWELHLGGQCIHGKLPTRVGANTDDKYLERGQSLVLSGRV